VFLLLKGRSEEAIAEVLEAHRLDPLSPNWNAWNAGWLADAGRYEEGVAELKKVIAMTPDHWLGHFELSGVYARGSRLDEARVEGHKAVELSGGASITVARLASVCHLLGDAGRGSELLERLKTRSLDTYVSPSFFAWVHLARGEPEPALRRLEEALRIKDPWLCFTRLYTRPFFPSDSRVDALLKDVGW